MLSISDHDSVRELRLARPPANALDPALVAALAGAVEAAPDEGARALVLAGSPGMFSGGLDVPLLLGLERRAMERFVVDFFRFLRTLAASRVPIVAAITGHAPAGGAVMAIFCDHRVMADGDFKIGLNEVRVGLSLPRAIASALELVVGARQAMRLGTGGLLLTAAEALAVGLVDELVPPEAVVERAHEVARDYLALPPIAMSTTRALGRARLVELFDAQHEATFARFVDDWFSDETQTTLAALVERLRKKS
ncbi:MAG TPA: enoyl-CoA hydratase/isomerase family protein [Thermoanaerobaculia bacterium]|nr:enoyl-CoA hydratase/isomerase family protein [Thermoanaerobaculia bacterium]